MLAGRAPRGLACDRGKRESEQFTLAEMHTLAQGIAHLQHAHDPIGEGLDNGDLQAEPEILHL
jgi:hypothetical protein